MATPPGNAPPPGTAPGTASGNTPSGNASQLPSQLPPATGPGDDEADLPTPLPYPSWDDASRTAAVGVAATAMGAFARPDTGAAEWWSALQPYLTANARAAYQDTDPAQVPTRSVTGPAVLVEDSSPYLAGVDVPTDVGVYRVLLAREGEGAPWLVERLTPPPSLQAPPAGPGGPP